VVRTFLVCYRLCVTVEWCLVTCYGHQGAPGPLAPDPPPGAKLMDPRGWPCPAATRTAVDDGGYAVLGRIARDLARDASLGGKISAALDQPGVSRYRRVADAVAAARDPREIHVFPVYTPAEDAVRTILGARGGEGESGRALARADVAGLAYACGYTSENNMVGGRYYDLIDQLLRRIVADRAAPAAQALARHFADDRGMWTGEMSIVFPTLTDALRPAVAALADRALGSAAGQAHEALARMTRLYQATGPVTVSITLRVPGHLPWDADEPVGLREIAGRLGVERGTADQWRTRRELPAATWPSVGGRPAWRWKVIEDWAIQTGRLTSAIEM
jgi:hypothetical protein